MLSVAILSLPGTPSVRFSVLQDRGVTNVECGVSILISSKRSYDGLRRHFLELLSCGDGRDEGDAVSLLSEVDTSASSISLVECVL